MGPGVGGWAGGRWGDMFPQRRSGDLNYSHHTHKTVTREKHHNFSDRLKKYQIVTSCVLSIYNFYLSVMPHKAEEHRSSCADILRPVALVVTTAPALGQSCGLVPGRRNPPSAQVSSVCW